MGHIIFIAIAIAISALLAWGGRKKDNDEVDHEFAEVVPKKGDDLRAIVKQLPVEIIKDKGTEFVVGFQGGSFFLTYIPFINSFEVTLFNINTATCEEMPTAVEAANYVNENLDVWKCHAQMREIGAVEKPCCISLSCFVPLYSVAYAVKNIKEAMASAFAVARKYNDYFEKEKTEKLLTLDNLRDADFRNKLTLAKNKWETLPHDTENKEAEDEVASAALTIRRLMALWVDAHFGKLLSLRLLAEGKHETITNEEKILDFNIYNFIFQYHSEAWTNDFALQLTTENEGLLFCLRRSDQCTDKTLFYNMAIYRTELNGSYHMEAYFSKMTIEVRLTSLSNDLWETKYMIEEALAKEKKEGFDNLSEEEKAIVAMATDSLQAHMYWGKRYFTAGCYYQSLEHFRYIYCHCRDNWYRLNEHGRHWYFVVCYYIGFIYLDMRMMEKAHYFLYTAAQTYDANFIQEYINCLCNMKDPSALSYISRCVNSVNELLGDKGPEESLLALRAFLERRYVFAQIDLHMYDEARQHLNEMIERGVSVDFAKNELRYLDLLEKANTNDTPEETN